MSHPSGFLSQLKRPSIRIDLLCLSKYFLLGYLTTTRLPSLPSLSFLFACFFFAKMTPSRGVIRFRRACRVSLMFFFASDHLSPTTASTLTTRWRCCWIRCWLCPTCVCVYVRRFHRRLDFGRRSQKRIESKPTGKKNKKIANSIFGRRT